jgi:Ca2+-transporting ATPase
LAVPGGSSLGQRPSTDGGATLVPPRSADSKLEGTSHEDEEDPLKPDPGTEHEFSVDNNPFGFSPGQLAKLFNPKNLHALRALGGIQGLERGLRTDLKAGLSLDENILDGQVSFQDATGSVDRNASIEPSAPKRSDTAGTQSATANVHADSFKDRIRVFKDNRLPERKSKTLLQLMWIALMDKVLLLLSAAAVISLALGLYQTFGVKHTKEEGAQVEWVEGVAIIIAILIVVLVGAGNDYQKERQFVKLNKKVQQSNGYSPLEMDADSIYRKRTVQSKLSVLESRFRSRFMTFWLVMCAIWSLVTSSPPMVSSSLATTSNVMNHLRLVNPIR